MVYEYLPQPLETVEDALSDKDEISDKPILLPSQNEGNWNPE